MGVFVTGVTVLILAVVLNKVLKWMKKKPAPDPKGFVKPGWERVERAFRQVKHNMTKLVYFSWTFIGYN